MTSFQSLTRRASTQHATLGDNHEGSDNRAPSCDSGFVSVPDISIDNRTNDVSDNKSSSADNEVIRLKKLVAQQQQQEQEQRQVF